MLNIHVETKLQAVKRGGSERDQRERISEDIDTATTTGVSDHGPAAVVTSINAVIESSSTTSPTSTSTTTTLPIHLAHLASIPDAPTLHPSSDEFADSASYLKRISREYSNSHGVVKIVPPRGWRPGRTIDLHRQSFPVRVQQIQKPNLQVKAKSHQKSSFEWMTKQSRALHAKWQMNNASAYEMSDNQANAQAVPSSSGASVSSGGANDIFSLLNGDVSPILTASSSPNHTTTHTVTEPVIAPDDAIRECMYEPMRQIIRECGTLDKVKRRQVEAAKRTPRAQQVMEVESPVLPSMKPSLPDHIVSLSSSPQLTSTPAPPPSSPRLPLAAAELSYWEWMYGHASSRTYYASDVECLPEYKHVRPIHPDQNVKKNRNHTSDNEDDEEEEMQFEETKTDTVKCEEDLCPYCDSGSCRLVYAPTSWDLDLIAWLPGGILRFLGGAAPGVTEAMIYAGIHHSTFPWHNEDHYLASISYMHASEDETSPATRSSRKVWYGVPGSSSTAFERVMEEDVLPELIVDGDTALSILPRKQTAFSPSYLVARGVPVEKVLHEPNTIIVTFPQAYHSGWSESEGANITESVNFCLEDWLLDGKMHPSHLWNAGCGVKAETLYRSLRTPIVLSHSKLILSMVDHILIAFHNECGFIELVESTNSRGSKKRARASSDQSSSADDEEVWQVRVTLKPSCVVEPPPVAAADVSPQLSASSISHADSHGSFSSSSHLPTCHELQLVFLRRVQSELTHLIHEEETLRNSVAATTHRLKLRQLDATRRREEEPDVEAGHATLTRMGASRMSDSSSTAKQQDQPETLCNIVCAICRTSCYLSYVDCACGSMQGEVICLRHSNDICRCGRAVVTFRYALSELRQLQQQLVSVIEHVTRMQKKAEQKERRKKSSPLRRATDGSHASSALTSQPSLVLDHDSTRQSSPTPSVATILSSHDEHRAPTPLLPPIERPIAIIIEESPPPTHDSKRMRLEEPTRTATDLQTQVDAFPSTKQLAAPILHAASLEILADEQHTSDEFISDQRFESAETAAVYSSPQLQPIQMSMNLPHYAHIQVHPELNYPPSAHAHARPMSTQFSHTTSDVSTSPLPPTHRTVSPHSHYSSHSPPVPNASVATASISSHSLAQPMPSVLPSLPSTSQYVDLAERLRSNDEQIMRIQAQIRITQMQYEAATNKQHQQSQYEHANTANVVTAPTSMQGWSTQLQNQQHQQQHHQQYEQQYQHQQQYQPPQQQYQQQPQHQAYSQLSSLGSHITTGNYVTTPIQSHSRSPSPPAAAFYQPSVSHAAFSSIPSSYAQPHGNPTSTQQQQQHARQF